MIDSTIHIHPMVFGAVVTVLGSLIAVIWWQLNSRIKKVEEWKVDKGWCKSNNALINEKFVSLTDRIADHTTINSREHKALGDGINKVDESIDDMHIVLTEMEKCMIKIASNKEC